MPRRVSGIKTLSIHSAKTLKARAFALAPACNGVTPYASTPGISGISAIHRPSSSCSSSISKFINTSQTPDMPDSGDEVYVLSQIWVGYNLNAGQEFIQSGGLLFYHIKAHRLNLHRCLFLHTGQTHIY